MGVRRAHARDIELVLQVINTSNRDAYRSIIPPQQFKDPILTPEQLMKEFDTMNFYVCRVEDQLVGVAALQIDESAAGDGQVGFTFFQNTGERASAHL